MWRSQAHSSTLRPAEHIFGVAMEASAPGSRLTRSGMATPSAASDAALSVASGRSRCPPSP
eukprot:7586700-Alexandrium_andersonii.AAC.1